MAVNPETKVTNRIRNLLLRNGAHFRKLSDSFSRGVPDSYVVTNRVVMLEYKVDRSKGTKEVRTYKSLGLSGAQDHEIKAVKKRAADCAFVVTDTVKGDRLRVWGPVNAFAEDDDDYHLICEGEENFLRLMGCQIG